MINNFPITLTGFVNEVTRPTPIKTTQMEPTSISFLCKPWWILFERNILKFGGRFADLC